MPLFVCACVFVCFRVCVCSHIRASIFLCFSTNQICMRWLFNFLHFLLCCKLPAISSENGTQWEEQDSPVRQLPFCRRIHSICVMGSTYLHCTRLLMYKFYICMNFYFNFCCKCKMTGRQVGEKKLGSRFKGNPTQRYVILANSVDPIHTQKKKRPFVDINVNRCICKISFYVY